MSIIDSIDWLHRAVNWENPPSVLMDAALIFLSMPGLLFDSERGRWARKRRQGLNAARTRQANGSDVLLERLLLVAGSPTNRPLKRALAVLNGASHDARCHCPWHIAAEYNFDATAIRNELERRQNIVRQQTDAIMREWKAEKARKALTRG